jgi:hypothetical protein
MVIIALSEKWRQVIEEAVRTEDFPEAELPVGS